MPFAIPSAWLLRVLYEPHVTSTGRIEYKETGVTWSKYYYIPQLVADMYQGQDRQTERRILAKAAQLGFLSNVPPVRTPLTPARDALAAYAVALALAEDSSPAPTLANGLRAPRFVSAPANLAVMVAGLGNGEPSMESMTVGKDRKRRMSGEEEGGGRGRSWGSGEEGVGGLGRGGDGVTRWGGGGVEHVIRRVGIWGREFSCD